MSLKRRTAFCARKYAVVAANGYGSLNRKVASRVMPINNYIIATEPLGDDIAKALIANGSAVTGQKFVINYLAV
ncbi:MAG: hypothetical protein R3C58_03790 [Parvularculaceae bacterium]